MNHHTQSISRRSVLAALVTVLGTGLSGWAHDIIPGAKQTKPIIITNATIHTVSGEVIQAGTLILKEGKIAEIGANLAIPVEGARIDAEGKHVYPGLIDPMSNIGLTEIDSVRATIDSRETGNINPNVRAAAAFNPDSELIPVARANGILLATSAPDGGLISGRSALMMMDGWTWEDMTLKADVGMHVNWPRSGGVSADAKVAGDLPVEVKALTN